ncbi:MAG TPA: GNAT family N-acetyltransferase [Burkholderiales bacterium]|jgi:ribosomal protein S18 acetylase RimI-like enzyme|nr:GNAT family N-acetyltransferase [Burkholderiales bacterium]
MAVPQIVYKPASLADALAIAELSRDLIETGLGWSWTPVRVANEIRDRDTIVLTSRHRSSIIGFAIMNFGDELGHLSLLAVRRDWQRRGVGRAMFQWLKSSALTAGIAAIGLELRAANHQARQFYRALGFEEAGYAPGYYRGRETALRMRLNLRPAALGFRT